MTRKERANEFEAGWIHQNSTFASETFDDKVCRNRASVFVELGVGNRIDFVLAMIEIPIRNSIGSRGRPVAQPLHEVCFRR